MIITTKEPVVVVSLPDLELQPNCTPHKPAQRHDSSSKCAPVHKGRLFWCLIHKDSPQEPGDRNATREVALCGSVRIGGCYSLEDESRNE
jgi:hypothetical protein